MTGTAIPYDLARDLLQEPTLHDAKIVPIEIDPMLVHRRRAHAEL